MQNTYNKEHTNAKLCILYFKIQIYPKFALCLSLQKVVCIIIKLLKMVVQQVGLTKSSWCHLVVSSEGHSASVVPNETFDTYPKFYLNACKL